MESLGLYALPVEVPSCLRYLFERLTTTMVRKVLANKAEYFKPGAEEMHLCRRLGLITGGD